MKIDIKYFNKEMTKLDFIGGDKSNWIDLRSAETVHLKAGEYRLLKLGVAMRLPDGFEAHMIPRSSTFKNYGVLQSNSMGLIDNSYSGDTDEWRMPVFCTQDTTIGFDERIAQFKLVPIMGDLKFNEVDKLDDISRGGLGSSGRV